MKDNITENGYVSYFIRLAIYTCCLKFDAGFTCTFSLLISYPLPYAKILFYKKKKNFFFFNFILTPSPSPPLNPPLGGDTGQGEGAKILFLPLPLPALIPPNFSPISMLLRCIASPHTGRREGLKFDFIKKKKNFFFFNFIFTPSPPKPPFLLIPGNFSFYAVA